MALTSDLGTAFEIQEGLKDQGPPLHDHPWEEAFYIIEGSVQVFAKDLNQNLDAGDFCSVPAGVPHGYRIVSEHARLLSITTDATSADVFAAIAKEVHSLPEDIHAFMAINQKYSVTFADF